MPAQNTRAVSTSPISLHKRPERLDDLYKVHFVELKKKKTAGQHNGTSSMSVRAAPVPLALSCHAKKSSRRPPRKREEKKMFEHAQMVIANKKKKGGVEIWSLFLICHLVVFFFSLYVRKKGRMAH